MKVNNGKTTVARLQVWASPGKEQSLDDLIEKYGDQIKYVDEEGNRVCLLLMGESVDG